MSFSRDPTALVRRFGTRDPFEIAGYLEIDVHFFHHPESKLPGLTCLVANRPSIFINKAFFEVMQNKDKLYTDEAKMDDIRQVGAHELGHAVQDREELKLSPIKEYEIFNVRLPREAAANSFAADILIDKEELLDLLYSKMTLLEIASSIHVNVNLLMYKIDSMRKEGYNLRQLPYLPKNNFMGSIHGSGSSEWCE
jgi:hypothetical protein